MDKVYHFSAPGRTEIGGNHTDHQHGCVIAAAVDMETTAEGVNRGKRLTSVKRRGLSVSRLLFDFQCRRLQSGEAVRRYTGV